MTEYQTTIRIKEAYQQRLERLAEYRGETVEQCIERVARNVLERVPRNLRPADRPLNDLPVREVGLADDGQPYIELENGRIFYDHPGKSRQVLMYHVMRDKTPRGFKPDTYSLGIEARRLYQERPPANWFPHGEDAVVVDAGAFVGYKAIAFLDALGPHGKAVAIEMAPENFALLKRNIESNDLGGRVVAHHAGVWSSSGTIAYQGAGWMQYTIADLAEKHYASQGEVPTDTLDHIFDCSDIDRVDYLNIQVNGAELEALRGLERWFDRVQVFRIAAYYQTSDGRPIADEVCQILKDRGCEIKQRTEKGSITAVNPGFAG